MPSTTEPYPIASHPNRSLDPVDGTVGRPTCHAFFGAGAARFILKSKREFQLEIPVAPPSADAAG
jgi:hypothetical protein